MNASFLFKKWDDMCGDESCNTCPMGYNKMVIIFHAVLLR